MYKNQKHFSSTRKTSSASTPKTYSKITIEKSTEYFSFFNKVITATTEKRTTSHQLTFVNVSFFDSFSRGREISKPSLPAFSSDFTFYLLFQRFFFLQLLPTAPLLEPDPRSRAGEPHWRRKEERNGR